ncbi:MAG: M20 family metallopeptidase [Bacteroidia bacterium]
MQARRAAEALLPKLIAWRRHFHQNPELSFEEYETQRFILERLREWGIPASVRGGTGVVAELCTAPHGPWIALRADMDALPLTEVSDRPYASQRAGVMHACGHDAHMAILLGTAYLLKESAESWQGGVRLIFQPGEERAPGGASRLIAEGVLSERPLRALWGLHVTPQLPVGQIGLRPGPFMAASDEVEIWLRSRGGHGAYPHLAPDVVVLGAHLLTQLQLVVSRAADPRTPTVLTFGIFRAGTAPNILPTEAYLHGTLRTFEESWRAEAKSRIQGITQHLAAAWQVAAEIKFAPGYPVLINDPELTRLTHQWSADLLGAANVIEMPLWLSSEDFAFYGSYVPTCFIRLGTAGANPASHLPVHNPAFDIAEEALAIGTALFTHLALEALRYFASN